MADLHGKWKGEGWFVWGRSDDGKGRVVEPPIPGLPAGRGSDAIFWRGMPSPEWGPIR